MSSGKASKSGRVKTDAWPLGSEFGLVSDEGWVTALRDADAAANPGLPGGWKGIVSLCREARPRSGADWSTAEQDAELKCGYPTPDYAGAPTSPEPGTADYISVLSQAAPTEEWMTGMRSAIDAVGVEEVGAQLPRIFLRTMQSGIGSLNRKGPNKEILRGLIWCAVVSPATQVVDALRQLAVWSIEHRTAQAKTIGLALAFAPCELAAAALRMIAAAAERPSPKTRFNRYASHVERTIGLRPEDSAERFVPTFGVDSSGKRKVSFGRDGWAELQTEGSSVALRFFDASGNQLNSATSRIRREHARELEEHRDLAKGLKKLLGTQRDRIESLMLLQPKWTYPHWKERYLNHPIVGALARRLIWLLDGTAVLFGQADAEDLHGRRVECRTEAQVELWHPIGKSTREIEGWRTRLESLSIAQPFKQAHREVYLLTEAERQTATYSNRFAAHVLRQNQFRAIALTRGWERPFLGGWDGDDEAAHRELPGGWKVEFWLNGTGDEHGATGALLYVSTDQVRFYRGNEGAPVQLDEVPPMIFSEAMRDVDLFVCVASVGNDPAWADGGPAGRYRDYWQNYSFGTLSETAQTRRDVLQRLVPRLKIASQCSFADKFLVVKGSLRTYKIHLGSGNILMEPNDQYLCIVPDRGSAAAKAGENVFLPFEGDGTLSIILSKAFLLAEDQKIKDPTILRQVRAD